MKKLIIFVLYTIIVEICIAANTRCKFSIVCDSFTSSKNGLCEIHTCHSYDCSRPVKVFLFNKQRFVAEYCDKHICGRICPTHKNPSYMNAMFKEASINGNFIDVKYCSKEKLNNSKYCKEHTCIFKNCKGAAFESWIRGTGMIQFRTSPGTLFTIQTFEKWDLRILDCCIGHSNTGKTEDNVKNEFNTDSDIKKNKEKQKEQ